MRFRIGKSLANLLSINWWRCSYRYVRGVIRYANGNYTSSLDDFYWILNTGSLSNVESLIHENIGLNYANLEDFNKAEYHLLKSLDNKNQDKRSYFYMWLGYVLLVKKKHEESLHYFRMARELGDKGMNKWLINHQYVKEHIDKLEGVIKEKYKEILTNN